LPSFISSTSAGIAIHMTSLPHLLLCLNVKKIDHAARRRPGAAASTAAVPAFPRIHVPIGRSGRVKRYVYRWFRPLEGRRVGLAVVCPSGTCARERNVGVIPKPCYREGVSPSRTLPRVAISSGKPFHPPGSGCGLDGGYPGIRGSDQGIPGVRRSFWDDLIVNPDYYTVFSDLINEVLSCIRDWRWTNAGFVVVDFDSAQVRRL